MELVEPVDKHLSILEDYIIEEIERLRKLKEQQQENNNRLYIELPEPVEPEEEDRKDQSFEVSFEV